MFIDYFNINNPLEMKYPINKDVADDKVILK